MVKRVTRSGINGFTLIEVMIVVLVVALLAAIAMPQYKRYVESTRRVDATSTLMRMAVLQERYFFQRSMYTTDIDELGGDLSPEGWYDITIDTTGCDENSCNAFTITATPTEQGPQGGDTRCKTFSINQTLRQTATGDDADNCWQQ